MKKLNRVLVMIFAVMMMLSGINIGVRAEEAGEAVDIIVNDYLSSKTGYSRKYIAMLLETTEGFSREEAYAAADRSGADYDQEAVYRALDIYYDNWVYLNRTWTENPTWEQIETYLNKGFYFTEAQSKYGVTQAQAELEEPGELDPDPTDPDPDPTDPDPAPIEEFIFEYDGQPHTFEFDLNEGEVAQYRYLKYGTGSVTWTDWTTEKPTFTTVAYANDENGVPYVDRYTVEVKVNDVTYTKYVKITPKDALIIVHDNEKDSGNPDPEFTYDIEGLVAGDIIEVTKLQRYSEVIGDTPDEDPGHYEGSIVATFIVNSNYKTKVRLGNFKIHGKNILVSKDWSDANDQDGLRPEDVTIKLLVNSTDTEKTLILNSANNWTDSFTNLYVYAAGEKISYSIEEVDVPGYDAVITGNMENGFIVTNNYIPITEPTPTEPTTEEPTTEEPTTEEPTTTIPEIVAGDEDEKTTPTTTQPSEVVAGDEDEVDVVPTGENYLYLVVATLFILSGAVVLVPAIKKVRVKK